MHCCTLNPKQFSVGKVLSVVTRTTLLQGRKKKRLNFANERQKRKYKYLYPDLGGLKKSGKLLVRVNLKVKFLYKIIKKFQSLQHFNFQSFKKIKCFSMSYVFNT